MGAMVLECTGFPPFARALQRELDISIFSWGTLLDYAYSVAVHRDYYGHFQAASRGEAQACPALLTPSPSID
jgi:hypothetical protein